MYRNRWLFLLVTFIPLSVWAADASDAALGKGPIHIAADALQGQNKPIQEAIYTGNVVMQQGDLVIHAAQLTIHAQAGKVEKAVATGNPVSFTMSSAQRHGYGQELSYEPGSGRIVLTGDAHLWQGKNEVTGNQVIYLLQSQQTAVTASAGQRVRSIFYPSKGSSDKP
ncbi:lipopolysaccharide transport periplasmic protein LptA [Acidithiobacillus sp. IBUN Pt1247-S3]|uniref:lipopolysaccharide transport periplasmic protein LptA n=1 Tax=Acidithiobacillus sp. IBUN Pt1247-S3 TaxID=3166642 RepID=UPI0034E45350